MADSKQRSGNRGADYDAVVVGASLAGCAASILLGRAGLRVALVEKRPDAGAFKRLCSHFIQASAVPTLERLGLMEPIMDAGALRSRARLWTPRGWIIAPEDRAGLGVNLRRERLDPIVREAAASTPGVELVLGRTACRMLWDEGAVSGVVVRDRDDRETPLRAPLTVGADGRDSTVVGLAGVKEKILPHGRFAYGAYFEDALPATAPDASLWLLDPDVAAAFPSDSGLVMYVAMPATERLPEFKPDPIAALIAHVSSVPDPPPIREGRHVGPILGKLDMTNRVRAPVSPGLALVGDAALATDPLFGIGCGWALQSGEWLADSVTPALLGEETLDRGLTRYRRRHRRRLRGHAFFIHDYATGRPFNPVERMMFAAAVRDPGVAATFDEYGTRRIGPARMLATTVPRVLASSARRAVAGRREPASA